MVEKSLRWLVGSSDGEVGRLLDGERLSKQVSRTIVVSKEKRGLPGNFWSRMVERAVPAGAPNRKQQFAFGCDCDSLEE